MTDKWDFYPLRVDDKPASIMVDLGLINDVPIRAFPCMAYIRLHMRNPRDDGLSSQEEYEALIAIEKAIEAALAASKDAIYVGRNTSDGCRDFYFYIAQAEGWTQRAAQLLEPFPHYKFISGSRPDPEWSTFLEFLYPGDEAMQTITNRWVCDSLAEKGDPLSAEREIDHWIYFPNPAARKLFIAAAAELGFGLRSTTDPEEAGENYGARIFRVDRPGHDCIDDVTLPLHRLAAKFGGDYDGWETVVLGEPDR
jgi:hypothetical protein